MRALWAALAVTASITNAEADENLLGQKNLVASAGQPFCLEQDKLQEFVMAALQQDRRWLSELEGCIGLAENTKLVVLEDLPSDSDIGHVVKVRAFSPRGKGSFLGYTISLGIKKSP